MKRFKDDAREVKEGFECGIGLEKFNDIKNGDVIVDTQGAVDLMGLVGQFINKSGGDSKPASTMGDSASAPAAATP